jgi:peptidoglycan/xylan/chitin deacetylase (PgdA/CDA1 family)
MTVPVLMYHSITANPPQDTAALAVDPGAFADQMALLAAEGFTPVPFGALTGPLPERPVVITFDDGYEDFHATALPILARQGFPATLFVTTGWLSDAGSDAAGHALDATLSWGQLGEAVAAGIEVGGHSHSHPQLDQLPTASLMNELIRNRKLLEDRLGAPVTTMAYPYGYSSLRVRRAVAATGYRLACAVANRAAPSGIGTALTTSHDDVLAVPRLTVRWGTSLETFGRIVRMRELSRIYRRERALTRGYAIVRRTRYAARRVTGYV